MSVSYTHLGGSQLEEGFLQVLKSKKELVYFADDFKIAYEALEARIDSEVSAQLGRLQELQVGDSEEIEREVLEMVMEKMREYVRELKGKIAPNAIKAIQ